MILRRLGNKKKLMPKLIAHFPPHKIWIEPFFGSGSAFFYKPKAKYNIVNDLDSDVFNLFQVVMNQKEELEKAFYMMPIHSDLLNYWKENEETEPIKKALRFLFLSNLTWMGKGGTLKYSSNNNSKDIIAKNIGLCFDLLSNVQLNNCDFRFFLVNINFEDRAKLGRNAAFIYNDPPYLGTGDNYSHSFKEEDSFDLFEANEKTGCKYAISEFDHPFILQQAKERNLNVIEIGERQNLKNRRTEILVTNYKTNQLELF
jgi:DNA adenine methylase